MRKVTVKLMGGLGNQMFQFAVAKKVCKFLNTETEIVIDTSFLEDRTLDIVFRNYDLSIFKSINCEIDNRSCQSNGKIVMTDENIMHLLSGMQLFHDKRDIYLDGYFQICDLIDDDMADMYRFESFTNDRCESFLEKNVFSDSLMVNVRRTDYVTRSATASFHGFLDQRYVSCALKKFKNEEFKNIVIFSDEPDWCESNLNLHNSIVVRHEYAGEKFQDYLHMMTRFKNMIIPNSSFAWWAAWISEKQGIAKKIVTPGKSLWFACDPERSDLIVNKSWCVLESDELLQ